MREYGWIYEGVEYWVDYDIRDGIVFAIKRFKDKAEAEAFAKAVGSVAVEAESWRAPLR